MPPRRGGTGDGRQVESRPCTGETTNDGSVRVFGMEAEVVSHGVRVLRSSVCHVSLAGPRDLHAVVGVDGGAPDLADLFNEA